MSLRPKRAWGMPGTQWHPQPRVEKIKPHELVTTGPPEIPSIPARNGFNGYFVLSPVIRACLTPSPADNSAGLTPTSRRQDHTTWHVREQAHSSKRLSRPLHPAPNVRDDRETPLER